MYVIFEGMDGSGKTTIMQAVAERIKQYGINPLLTSHPGSTSLGKHLRKLVKNPESINKEIIIDPLSRQLIYFTDFVNFVKTILEPIQDKKGWIFADRSTIISAMIYGSAEGLNPQELEILYSIISPPKADRLYIMTCPVNTAISRINSSRSEQDHFDYKPVDFFKKIHASYENLLYSSYRIITQKVVSVNRIKYFSTVKPIEDIVDNIIQDLNIV